MNQQTTAMPELPESPLRSECWHEGKHHTSFYTADQMDARYLLGYNDALATLQAQPAAVSDAEIERVINEHSSPLGIARHDLPSFARAILALRPQAVPMTEQWRLLNSGDQIQAGDECLQDDCVTWLPLAGWEVGMTYNPHVLVPMRRRAEAHHGITAQAKEVG